MKTVNKRKKLPENKVVQKWQQEEVAGNTTVS